MKRPTTKTITIGKIFVVKGKTINGLIYVKAAIKMRTKLTIPKHCCASRTPFKPLELITSGIETASRYSASKVSCLKSSGILRN